MFIQTVEGLGQILEQCDSRPASGMTYQNIREAITCELERKFTDPNDPRLYQRRARLRELFKATPPGYAQNFYTELTLKDSDLAKLFHHRLATATRNELLNILRAILPPKIIPPAQPAPPKPQPPPPAPQSKSGEIQPPRSVAEAIELLEKAQVWDESSPRNRASALAAVIAVQQWMTPLTRKFDRYFKVGGGLRGLRDAQEKRLARQMVFQAFDLVTSTMYKLHLGATIGGYWAFTLTATKAGRYFWEILADEGVSYELRDAPPYRPSLERKLWQGKGYAKNQVRVLWWLHTYKRRFLQAERKFGIDRRAIAGAIAWEALENPMFFTFRSVGPGKMHIKTGIFGGEDTLAKQIEDAGYVEKRSPWERSKLLSTPSGAIMYIAASMKAAADIAWQELSVDIYQNPGVLTAFYQAYDLKKWRKHQQNKRAKGEQTFTLKDTMPVWVAKHLDYLEIAVGKPNFVPQYPQRIPVRTGPSRQPIRTGSPGRVPIRVGP